MKEYILILKTGREFVINYEQEKHIRESMLKGSESSLSLEDNDLGLYVCLKEIALIQPINSSYTVKQMKRIKNLIK